MKCSLHTSAHYTIGQVCSGLLQSREENQEPGIKQNLSCVEVVEPIQLLPMKVRSMNPTTLAEQLVLPAQALLFDLDTWYARLQKVKDQRKRRGVRYPLADVLLISILAKLAGQTSSRAIAEWAQLRHQELARLFALRHQRMPHFSTWSRILGHGCDPHEIEEVLGQFFAEANAQPSRPGERQLCIDGKTLRGTIPLR